MRQFITKVVAQIITLVNWNRSFPSMPAELSLRSLLQTLIPERRCIELPENMTKIGTIIALLGNDYTLDISFRVFQVLTKSCALPHRKAIIHYGRHWELRATLWALEDSLCNKSCPWLGEFCRIPKHKLKTILQAREGSMLKALGELHRKITVNTGGGRYQE